MRLHSLSMSFIGPYAGLAEVDFDALGDVFLVCGKTGSGKTTIFESVAYALYGQDRSSRDLASQFAGPEDDSYARLEFSIGRDGWRVTRKPARIAAKRRGGGTTERPSEVLLERKESRSWVAVADKSADVQRIVEGAVGLSAEEFTKIVLLPQGEFQKFLEMNTGDRTPILEKLFPVGEHAAVSALAAAKAKEAEAAAKVLGERVRSIEESLGPEPEASLEAARSSLDAARVDEAVAFAALDASKAAAGRAEAGAKAWAEFDAASMESEGLEAGAGEALSLAARVERAEAANSARHAVEAARKARSSMAEAATAAVRAAAELESIESRVEEMAATRMAAVEAQAEAARIDAELGKLSVRADAWVRLEAAERAAAAARAAMETAEAARFQAASLYAEAAHALKAIETGRPDPSALSLDRDRAAAELEEAREELRRSTDAASRRASIDRLREKVDAEKAASELARRELKRASIAAADSSRSVGAARDSAAAALLAATLAPGAPCPVCGSTEHPAPAAHSASAEHPLPHAASQRPLAGCDGTPELAAPSMAELESRAALATAAADAARDEAASSAARLAELVSRLEAEAAALDAVGGSLTVAEAEGLVAAAESKAAMAAEALAREAARGSAEREARAEVERLRIGLDTATAAAAESSRALASAGAAAAEAATGAGGSDPRPRIEALRAEGAIAAEARARAVEAVAAWETKRTAAAARSAELSIAVHKAEAELGRAEPEAAMAIQDSGFPDEAAWEAALLPPRELSDAKAAVRLRIEAESARAARLDAATRSVEGLPRPDAGAAAAAVAAADRAYAESRAALDVAAKAEADVSGKIERLQAERAAMDAHAERVRGLVSMARLLNGDTDGRRLSFKNFALASYFAAVVDSAGRRLREMSADRYELRAVEGRSSGRGRVGLDLEVIDSYTGKARPASSLSGGEKFLASVSLALGLSDVIVSRSGGVSLDSIFIDEGFGSLDDETLDRAIAALDRVRGDRVIGIVSHVGELKARFPARVEVRKSASGSTIEIVS